MTTLRVGLVGHGAIGTVVAAALQAGDLPGVELSGVLTRTGDGPCPAADITSLIDASDVVVEAAGQQAVRQHARVVLDAGRDLVVTSVGALVDDALRHDLEARTQSGGRLLLTSGAIGGLDLLRAAAREGGLDDVMLTTTKPPRSCAEPSWMAPEMLAALEEGTQSIQVFEGTAREAAMLFPRSLNVGAALALATIGLDNTRVVMIADPDVNLNVHVITACGQAGNYSFSIENAPSPDNPRTSALTANAVLRLIGDRTTTTVAGA